MPYRSFSLPMRRAGARLTYLLTLLGSRRQPHNPLEQEALKPNSDQGGGHLLCSKLTIEVVFNYQLLGLALSDVATFLLKHHRGQMANACRLMV